MKIYSPTTPSRRKMSSVGYEMLTARAPHKPLVKKLPEHAGRNSKGRITTRHQGGGHKRLYRIIDFKQNKHNVSGRVESLEYDPYRTAFIALIVYQDGERRYVLAWHGAKVGDTLITSEKAPLRPGNRLPLRQVPVGYQVFNVELQPGKGGQLARSAGSYVEVLAHENGYANLKLSSGEVRRVLWGGFCSVGQVSNPDVKLMRIGKAGRMRWLGIRPTVRGSAMNPVDHPYGGGEGRAQRGTRRPKTRWGKVTGGRKTRKKNKWSNALIVERRKKRKK